MEARDLLPLLGGWKGVSRLLRERSLAEGVWRGNKGWLGVAAVVWGAYGLRKAVHRDEKVLTRVVLKPGQQVSVSEPIVRPTRRQARRAARRAGPSS
jgi:hypothetical protein